MKNLINNILKVLLVLAPLTVATAADIKAPFGLSWGIFQDDLFYIMTCRKKYSLKYCQTPYVPKPLGDGQSYTLVFDEVAGLVKVTYVGKMFEKDARGVAGQARFAELRSGLTRKYPTAEKEEKINMHKKVFTAPEEFYQCLNYDDCGEYQWRVLGTPGGLIELKINGYYRGRGNINLTYESPLWENALKNAGPTQEKLELDAL